MNRKLPGRRWSNRQSKVYANGRTVIPKAIRDALELAPGTKLHWSLEGNWAHVRPMPADPIDAAIGALKHVNISAARLLEDRRADRDREEPS